MMPDRTTIMSNASQHSSEGWQIPLHNKDRLFVVLLDDSIRPGTFDWALLLSPKKSKRGMKESTLFQLVRAPNDKGVVAWEFVSLKVDASLDSLPTLRARFLILKVKPFQEAFFEEEFYGVPIVSRTEWGAKEWVCDCVDRLRSLGLAQVPTADEVEDAVSKWQWEGRGSDNAVPEVDLRVRT